MFEIERPVYVKDAPPRVFDTHVHYPWRQRASKLPIYTAEGMLDMLAYNCQRLNIYRVCLLGSPGEGNNNVEKAAERYPDLIVPFAMINVDQTQPAEITEFAERGFKGLKIINPRKNYDDTSYFPLYERAEQHGLVVLFHTGISGGMVDYLQFPPTSHEQVAELSRGMESNRRWQPESEVDSWYGAARMQPIFLDGISVAFPELKIIGAHLGYGLYDSAAAVARWRRNVFFDISGGTVVRRHIIERNMLRSEVSTMKLTWGSDCDMAHMSRELSNWMQAFSEIGLSAAEQDQIFWGTAARIFGVDAS
ncbi:MAG: amidohydrolase family protein [Chloroflexi bacterium]|nr:amidohydrolase family protein [Chloroflexota bacterium]MBV9600969.1 amidohydrolase family protein [Chloroflexota bacterium]